MRINIYSYIAKQHVNWNPITVLFQQANNVWSRAWAILSAIFEVEQRQQRCGTSYYLRSFWVSASIATKERAPLARSFASNWRSLNLIVFPHADDRGMIRAIKSREEWYTAPRSAARSEEHVQHIPIIMRQWCQEQSGARFAFFILI